MLCLDALVFLAIFVDHGRQCFNAFGQAVLETLGFFGRDDEDGGAAVVSVAIAALTDFGKDLVMRR